MIYFQKNEIILPELFIELTLLFKNFCVIIGSYEVSGLWIVQFQSKVSQLSVALADQSP